MVHIFIYEFRPAKRGLVPYSDPIIGIFGVPPLFESEYLKSYIFDVDMTISIQILSETSEYPTLSIPKSKSEKRELDAFISVGILSIPNRSHPKECPEVHIIFLIATTWTILVPPT